MTPFTSGKLAPAQVAAIGALKLKVGRRRNSAQGTPKTGRTLSGVGALRSRLVTAGDHLRFPCSNQKRLRSARAPERVRELKLCVTACLCKRARGYGGPPPDPETLRTFSELEWPAFDVGWPSEGTFNLPLLYAIQGVVYRVPHPDQMIYIDVWVDIATERPKYIRCCQSGRNRMRQSVCVAARQRPGGGRKTPLQEQEQRHPRVNPGEKTPPQEQEQRKPQVNPGEKTPPQGQEQRKPHVNPGEKTPPQGQEQRKPRLYPVLPEQPEDSLLAPTAPPPYNPTPQPDSTTGEELMSPPHTRRGTLYGAPHPQVGGAGVPLPGPGAPHPQVGGAGVPLPGPGAPHPSEGGANILPLREVPPGPDAPAFNPPRLVYVPFSTSDLYNWKLQNPPFSEKPQGLISLLETVFRTHQPTWDDCQQILQTLFTSEERERILREAEKAVREEEGGLGGNRRGVGDILPNPPPDWDPNSSAGREALFQYRRALLRGVRAAARKPTNFSKKLQATITFKQTEVPGTNTPGPARVEVTVPLSEEYLLATLQEGKEEKGVPETLLSEIPRVWAETNPPGLALHQPPVLVQLKSTASPIRVRQYPVPSRARQGIAQHLKRLLKAGILRECQSAWNTPLLPVQKPGTADYRPVQDLREVNMRVETIHPTVPNPYTLLSSLPPTHTHYSVLDLKDAFFCIPLARQSQEIFAFEWNDPENGLVGQYTWTRLPQGFKNSPTIFSEALGKDLQAFHISHPTTVLLQYVDDILIAERSAEKCEAATKDLLRDLEKMGYRVSAKKAQIVTQTVSYLGYNLQNGQRTLSNQRIQTVLQIPEPTSKRQVREFLGAVGYCRLWILGFAELAQPLHQLTWGKEEKFERTSEARRAFQALKEALVVVPALALPDLSKPFQLFIAEKEGTALGVLCQELGPWRRPVAYLSRRLDPVASGWPACLRALAATSVLVKEASKLTLGQDIQVIGEHYLEQVLRAPPDRWLSNARLTQYQAQLLNPPAVQFVKTTTLNPATLLPLPDAAITHNCTWVLDSITGSRPDLRDQAYDKPDLVLFTDGSSFMREGRRLAGAAVTTETKVIWQKALPAGTSAQRAELIGLIQALRLAEGKTANIYTDSRYAFATAHIHGAIYKERGLLTAGGKEVKNKEEILALLEAIWLPAKVAIIHCRGHQKGESPIIRGNELADAAARKAAEGEVVVLPLIPRLEIPPKLIYTPEEEQVNAQNKKYPPLVRYRGKSPGELWEVDFTEMGPGKSGYKYLLVLVDTYSGWTEAFPTKGETASIVCKPLLREIIPRYGLPLAIGSDNGPAFVSKVSQELASKLMIEWKLHCVYRPQSSGQVERMNRTLKETIIKLKEETGENWVELLPFALFRVRYTPYVGSWTPYEIMFGQPVPIIPKLSSEEIASTNYNFLKSLQALQQVRQEIRVLRHQPPAETTQWPTPPEPGQWVWILNHRRGNLEPRWVGPFQVLLSTLSAVRVAEKPYWIHLSHTKPAQPPREHQGTWRVSRDPERPLSLKFLKQ
ncbi:uncharacterized protein LOC128627835 [Artibeus jamaicensis]|uniref:uncharacterized protein LOC128627835 n=1 Tax=Artibeus jamaicensis TaxID=9417 RepID=UPI00235A8CC0|nr:uncharacterized protein LOC128627835 [Artibeus jamaicensis]